MISTIEKEYEVEVGIERGETKKKGERRDWG